MEIVLKPKPFVQQRSKLLVGDFEYYYAENTPRADCFADDHWITQAAQSWLEHVAVSVAFSKLADLHRKDKLACLRVTQEELSQNSEWLVKAREWLDYSVYSDDGTILLVNGELFSRSSVFTSSTC